MKSVRIASLFVLSLLLSAQPADLLKELKFRNIGPYRGGRSIAVTGVPSQPNVYYFGSTGGGVWKTTDSGNTWHPVTDGQVNGGHLFHTYFRALGLDPRRNHYTEGRPIPMADPDAAPIREVLA